MRAFFLLGLTLFSLANLASYEDLVGEYVEAQILVDARNYLKVIKDDLNQGRGLNKQGLLELEKDLGPIARTGCVCPQVNHLIRAQAYALIGAINGVISKETKSISHGKKSYHKLVRARELDPRNVDAIRGQGEALKAILNQGFFARNIVAMTLGVNLTKETRQLISDLRTFKDNRILLRLADQLSGLL
jgi:hypothetical protein